MPFIFFQKNEMKYHHVYQLTYLWFQTKEKPDLTGMAQQIGHCPAHQIGLPTDLRVAGSVPRQGTCLG